jgi:spermidine/putrescine transport system permease protein
MTLRRWFLSPAAAILALLFAGPLAIVGVYSLRMRGVYGGVTGEWTLENYARLFDPLYGAILLRTVVIAASTTLLCLALAFPLAWFIANAGKRRNLYLQLVMLPFWTSFLVRTYAWMFLLRDTGLINAALQGMGLISAPLPLLYNDAAVILGLVYTELPFAVLPLYAAVERLDRSLVEAAADLGARPLRTVAEVIVPLCAPGFRAAAVLVFIPSLGAFLTPDLLGGGRTVMVGNLVQNQFTTARDWPFGSAVALVLMALVLALLLTSVRREKEELL